MAVSVLGMIPTVAHQTVLNTLKTLVGAAQRLATCTAHPPATTRPAAGIGGVYLCNACSPGASRVAWPCPPYRGAAGPDITDLY